MKKYYPNRSNNSSSFLEGDSFSFDQYCQVNQIAKLENNTKYLTKPKNSTFRAPPPTPPLVNYSMILDESSIKQKHYVDGQKHISRDLYNGRYLVIAQIDLHNFNRTLALEKLAIFLKQHTTPNQTCLKVIHGYGHNSIDNISILKLSVRKYLEQHSHVLAYSQARANNGGDGVTLIKLKKVK